MGEIIEEAEYGYLIRRGDVAGLKRRPGVLERPDVKKKMV